MELSEYLQAVQDNPRSFPKVKGCDRPPLEWTAVAWETEEVQQTIAYELADDVSSNGEMGYRLKRLKELAAALTTEQAVNLFRSIRDMSPHRESEFRPQFEAAFAAHAAALPPPLTRDEVIAALLAIGFDKATAAYLLGESNPLRDITK